MMMMYGRTPHTIQQPVPPTHTIQPAVFGLRHCLHHTLHHVLACFHYVTTLRPLLCPTVYDLHCLSCLRVNSLYLSSAFQFQTFVLMFQLCIFYVWLLMYGASNDVGQRQLARWCVWVVQAIEWCGGSTRTSSSRGAKWYFGCWFCIQLVFSVFFLSGFVSKFWATFMCGAKNTSYLQLAFFQMIFCVNCVPCDFDQGLKSLF